MRNKFIAVRDRIYQYMGDDFSCSLFLHGYNSKFVCLLAITPLFRSKNFTTLKCSPQRREKEKNTHISTWSHGNSQCPIWLWKWSPHNVKYILTSNNLFSRRFPEYFYSSFHKNTVLTNQSFLRISASQKQGNSLLVIEIQLSFSIFPTIIHGFIPF